jgi:hypothetical protein
MPNLIRFNSIQGIGGCFHVPGGAISFSGHLGSHDKVPNRSAPAPAFFLCLKRYHIPGTKNLLKAFAWWGREGDMRM